MYIRCIIKVTVSHLVLLLSSVKYVWWHNRQAKLGALENPTLNRIIHSQVLELLNFHLLCQQVISPVTRKSPKNTFIIILLICIVRVIPF